jgi:predicted lactoylglutathione lyase
VTLPQQITFITLGARELPALRAFYRALGWIERPGSDDNFAAFDAGTVRMALYPLGRLGDEAAPGERAPEIGWNGVTLGVNVESPEAVDSAFQSALAAGAERVADPVKREWGGYTGYFADPEGNRWEVAWSPYP